VIDQRSAGVDTVLIAGIPIFLALVVLIGALVWLLFDARRERHRADQTASNARMDVAREFVQVAPLAGSRKKSAGGQFATGDPELFPRAPQSPAAPAPSTGGGRSQTPVGAGEPARPASAGHHAPSTRPEEYTDPTGLMVRPYVRLGRQR